MESDSPEKRPAAAGSLIKNVTGTLGVWVRGPVKGRLAQWAELVPVVASFEPELQSLTDGELRKRSLSVRYRAKSRVPLTQLLPEAYALVREAGVRTIGQRHFDVQILGGIALHHRSVAEMQTGEGKTLTATLPLYLTALTGHGRPPRHGQRLSGPARRRVDGTDLSPARLDRRRRAHADEHGSAPRGLCLRHHLRHGQGIRLRLSPRSVAAAAHRRGAKRFDGSHAGTSERRLGRQARAAAAALRAG